MSRSNPPTFLLLLLSLLLSVGLSACIVGDFMGAYFNTYYNAQKLFAEAEEDIWSQQDTRLSGRNLLLPLNVSGTSRQKLTSVIDKCSKLLQYHPESRLVDDALLMIGKAFYYQADFTRAERKFKELMETYPQSGLVLEARMWLGYSLYKQGKADDAVTEAKSVMQAAADAGDDGILAYAALLLGQIEQDRKNFTAAQGYFEQAADKGDNSDLRASAYLTAADMYALSGDSVHAYETYRRAGKEASNYIGEYRAKIGQAKMLGKLGRGEEALAMLDDMRRNTNYREFWGQINFEMGNVYRSMDAFDSAIKQYVYVDTAYARSEWAANADYQLGQLYERQLGRLDSARNAYNRARGAAGQQWQVAPLVTQRADLLNRYMAFRNTIRQNDSLRIVILHISDSLAAQPPEPPRDSIARKPDSLGAPQRFVPPQVSMDSVDARVANAMNELATLFFSGLAEPDSAVAVYDTLLQRYPSSPHTPRALYTLAQIYFAKDSVANRTRVDSLYERIVGQFPNSEFAVAARRGLGLPALQQAVDPAEEMYHRCEQSILAGRFQDAVDSLKQLSARYPGSAFASRAEYAAGWIYEEKLEQPDSAIAAYKRLASAYPSSMYAAQVRPKLDAVEQAKNAASTNAQQQPAGAPGAGATAAPSANPAVQPPGQGQPAQAPASGRASHRMRDDDSVHIAPPRPSPQDSSKTRRIDE